MDKTGWIDSSFNVALNYDDGKKISVRLNLNQQNEMANKDVMTMISNGPVKI
ncbi:MAG: hypothetical protein HRT37_14050 [Alteromonadaceae bacterium]|nr:hypothetical protein [Alteromonadaceae bacterium]